MNEVLRQEKKYLITAADVLKLSSVFEKVMLQDEHNGSCGYMIRSLYFDTVYDIDYNDKIEGLELRRKIRLRVYDPKNDFAMLEMKQKHGDFQKKRSLKISREDAKQLILCNYEVLKKYNTPFAAECYGFMHMHCYRPKTVVEYNRKAFIAKENKIRVTIDTNIRANENCFDIFSENLPLFFVLDPFNAVLEIKFNGFMLSYIKTLTNFADKSNLSISKYCLARSSTLKFSL